ncbi:MAG: sodium:calcium antiporter [Chloroflexi bacterium]|nr:sodium:calcium antiporter [Chloroflexota bacterium]
MTPLLGVPAYGLLFALALVLLERGADLLTDAIGELAERTGASETVIGLLTAGLEWEELVVATLAAATGNVGIAVGTLIGANVANITGSFALGPLVRPIAISADDRRWALVMLAITVGVGALLLVRPQIGRAEGLLLLATFVAYVVGLLVALRRGMIRAAFVREAEGEEAGDEATGRGLPGHVIRAVVGLALIVAGAEAIIRSGLFFAGLLGVSDYVVGLTLVAIGTTLPDKVISIAGALKDRPGIVTANVIGSNVFNLTFALGLAAVVEPLVVDAPTRAFDIPALLATSAVLVWLFRHPRVGRAAGLGLLLLYVGYLGYQFAGK